MKKFDFNPLLDLVQIIPRPAPGVIYLTDRMEPPEENPLNDWLYPGILALKDIAQEKKIKSVACIGTGQGIDAVVVSHIFHPETLFVTDIVGKLLPQAQKNIEFNTLPENMADRTVYIHGDGCEVIPEKVDLITFSPPPLMVYNRDDIDNGIARTTIIEAERFLNYASDSNDIKLKWSTLPQYVFLLSAIDKLKPNGSVLTLYTGRIPFSATEAAFHDAGFDVIPRYQVIKFQTDPQFLKEYAYYEAHYLHGELFDFYDYEIAAHILSEISVIIPGIIHNYTDSKLKKLLQKSKIGAVKAYESFKKGRNVVHIGYALEGKLKKTEN